MQQQFQGDPDGLQRALPGYSLRSSPRRAGKQREISPWGSIQESKRIFNPSHYYETITSERRETRQQHRNRSTPLADGREQSMKRYRYGRGPFLRNSKNSALIYTNQAARTTLTVDLDEAVSPDRLYGKTVDSFHVRPRREEGKEQPVRVRIFKKIQQKNQQAEDEYTQRAAEFAQDFEGQQDNPFGSIDGNSIYQAMPKRNARISYQRTKGHSVLETTRNGFFPKISIEKERLPVSQKSQKNGQRQQFFCKGEVITSKKEVQSMRRVNFRSAQLDGDRCGKEQGVVFLKKYSYQQ